MTTLDPILLGEKLAGLLNEAALTSTYKPALLLALIDRCQERSGDTEDSSSSIPVRELALRVIELYWPQTLTYPATGSVLWQNQGGRQARIVQRLVAFRAISGATTRATLAGLQQGRDWDRLVKDVEWSLAEMPVPRLQEPYGRFLYDFDWPSDRDDRWSAGAYAASSRNVTLREGVAGALVSLGPLLRPFLTRWWADKAAALNRNALPDAQAMVDFEQFLFGPERVALRRLTNPLMDLQLGDCFYCRKQLTSVEVDHFMPWSHSADNGLDNLVAACRSCNNAKRAMLPAARHLRDLLERNERYTADLAGIASERLWPRDSSRTGGIVRSLYLASASERPTWAWDSARGHAVLAELGGQRAEVATILAV